jgi:hypothetical protein
MQMEENRWAWRRKRPDTNADNRNWSGQQGAPLYVLLDLPWQRLETVHTLVPDVRTSHTRAV